MLLEVRLEIHSLSRATRIKRIKVMDGENKRLYIDA